MIKTQTLGKMKITKDKLKKERHEEGQAHSILKGTTPTPSKSPAREKDKTRLRKDYKKKKSGKGSIGDGSQEDSEEHSPAASRTLFEDHTDVHRLKGKRRISKECEENVNNAVSQFFDSAWKICAERFFISSAPLAVSVELRNTWLRIVEAEWQDPDMREKISAGNNRIFKSDEPPLPSAFDSWSRGAITSLPRAIRESVMDPFLRDLADPTLGQLPYLSSLPFFDIPSTASSFQNINIGHGEIIPDGLSQDNVFENKIGIDDTKPISIISESTMADIEAKSVPNVDRWNFDLDQPFSQNLLQNQPENEMNLARGEFSSSVLVDDSKLAISELAENEIPKEDLLVLLPTSKQILNNDSTTECDDPLPRAKGHKKLIHVAKKFSPSQCGGDMGSGLFRLINETTSEALLAREKTGDDIERVQGLQILEQKALEYEDIVQVSNKRNESFVEPTVENTDDEPKVQPLFEEHTLRKAESMQRFQGSFWGSRSEAALKTGDLNLEQTVSDENNESNRFLKRILINLHGRFKRQTIRFLAARANEDTMERFSINSSFMTSDVSKTSIITGGTRASRNKNKRASSKYKIISGSASNHNMLLRSASSYSIKNAASDPNIPKYLRKGLLRKSNVSVSNFSATTAATGNVKVFKKMLNVRASDAALKSHPNNTARRFQDSVIRTSAQVEAQARFENAKRHIDGIDNVKDPMSQAVLSTNNVPTMEGYVRQER